MTPRKFRAARLALGRAGESAAARYLEQLGCKLLARNCRTKEGELDLVAADGAILVFVEVKTLREKPGFTPAGNLSLAQRRRNKGAADRYMSFLDRRPFAVRYDLIEVVFRGRRIVDVRRRDSYLPPEGALRRLQ